MSELHEIAGCDNPERRADVLFLHGLWGDPFATWRYGGDAGTSWPHWLGQDFPDVGVWSLGYAASGTKWTRPLGWLSPRWRDAGHAMPLPDRALQVLDLVVQRGLGQRPIMLVCHSLGGLLAKQILRKASEAAEPREKAVFSATRAVLFLATPHAGTSLASLANAFRIVFRASVSVQELRAHDAHLRDLLNWYRNHSAAAGIRTITYFETRDAFGARIVDETSSHPGVGADPVGLDEDHLSIAKPRDRNAQVYRSAVALLRDHVVPSSLVALAPARATVQSSWDFIPAAGLVGMTRYGPWPFAGGPNTAGPVAVRSWEEFNKVFGDSTPLRLADGTIRPCYAALAARVFFESGGRKLYVSRVYSPGERPLAEGFARCALPLQGGLAEWCATWPGSGGNLRVDVRLVRSPGVVYRKEGRDELQVRGATHGDVLEVLGVGAAAAEQVLQSNLRVVQVSDGRQVFVGSDGGEAPLRPRETASFLRFTVSVGDGQRTLQAFEGLSTNPASREFIGECLGPVQHDVPAEGTPAVSRDRIRPMVCLRWDPEPDTTAQSTFVPARLAAVLPGTHRLAGGHDGAEPSPAQLDGVGLTAEEAVTGLRALEFDDIGCLLMPDAAAYADRALSFEAASHLAARSADGCGRVALVDPPLPGDADAVLNLKDNVPNKPVAVFCPWLVAESPDSGTPVLVPPSGFVAGCCCARSPLEEGPPATTQEPPGTLRVGTISAGRELAVLEEEGINVVQNREGRVELTGSERMTNGEELFGPWRLVRHIANALRRGLAFKGFLFEPVTAELLAQMQADAEAWLAGLRQRGLLYEDAEEPFSVRCEGEEAESVLVTLELELVDRLRRNLTFRLSWWREG